MPIPSRIRSLRVWSAIAAGVLLAACSSNVIVESKFPSPLVEALPVRMGIIIPEELYNYIYTEEIRDESLWTIALGDANVAMLKPLYSKMFQETRKVDAVRRPTSRSTACSKTTLEKFEFDVPSTRRTSSSKSGFNTSSRCSSRTGTWSLRGPSADMGSTSSVTAGKTPCRRPRLPRCAKSARRFPPSLPSSLRSRSG